VNILAVLLAAVSSFLLGGLWYSKVMFGRVWHTENTHGQPQPAPTQQGHPAKVFGVSFIFSLIAATAFAIWLGPAPALPVALKAGAIAGFGFVAASYGINYQFAQRSLKLWLIDGGYHGVQFVLFGLVLGTWH